MNQENSQSGSVLPGSNLPIEEIFNDFIKTHTVDLSSEQLHTTKMLFYMASTSMYNLLMGVLHQDHSLQMLSIVSEDVRKDIDQYFSEQHHPMTTH